MSSIIETITGNPIVKNSILNMLKKAFAKEGIKLITVATDEKGELVFGTYINDVSVFSVEKVNDLVNERKEAIKMIAELNIELTNLKKQIEDGHK